MIYNNLKAEIYPQSSTSRITDPSGDLDRIRDIQFDTFYPGGLYGQCSFTARRKLISWWALQGAQRLVLINGNNIVWEGLVDNLQGVLAASDEYVRVTGTGWWGALAMRRRWRKRWADTRTDQNTWEIEPPASLANAEEIQVNIDRKDGLKIVPQSGEDWGNNEYFKIRYTNPQETNQTIERIVFSWKFSEGSQAWTASLYDVTNSSTIWTQASTSTTGTAQDFSLSPESQILEFRLTSNAAQTTPANQSVYLHIYGLTVYGEAETINSTKIIQDVQEYLTECNTDTSLIGSNTYALPHFVADNWETVGETMIRVASYGDGNQDAWGVGLRHSESVAAPNGEPVPFFELQPALTDYDYVVRLDELAAPINLVRDYSKIANWLIVRYQDALRRQQYATPISDANLGDTTSQTSYGRRDSPEKILSYGEATVASAINLARRYLNEYNDPVYNLASPLQVRRYIRAKGGNLIPASEIQAGKRIMIEDYLLATSGLTWLITKTTYNDETQICSIQAGTPDPFAVIMARLKLIADKLEGIELV